MSKRIIYLECNECIDTTADLFREANLIYRPASDGDEGEGYSFYVLKNRYGRTGLCSPTEVLNFIKEDIKRDVSGLKCVYAGEKIENTVDHIVPKSTHPVSQVALEDIATEFASEFVNEAFSSLQIRSLRYLGYKGRKSWYVPFLKMSYKNRRKLVSKVLDKMKGQK